LKRSFVSIPNITSHVPFPLIFPWWLIPPSLRKDIWKSRVWRLSTTLIVASDYQVASTNKWTLVSSLLIDIRFFFFLDPTNTSYSNRVRCCSRFPFRHSFKGTLYSYHPCSPKLYARLRVHFLVWRCNYAAHDRDIVHNYSNVLWCYTQYLSADPRYGTSCKLDNLL
jgi:hypothetical protein